MSISALACPNCGAPVAPRLGGAVTCAYCMRTLTGVPEAAWAALLLAKDDEGIPDGRLTCRVAGVLYAVRGLLARGARADVLLAERVRCPTELVVLKVLRAGTAVASDAASREHALLVRLAGSTSDAAPFFTTLLPQPLGVGPLQSRDLPERPAIAYRWRSGFQHTLADVREAYPHGIDGRAAVWMWRRVLALLAWTHATGFAHGAVVPEHVLVHPRDHAAVLVGWSKCAARATASEAADIAMSARAILHTVDRAGLPEELGRLLDDVATGALDLDARALADRVLDRATAAFGPPTFHPFTMPGWR
jgi:hypothetical protein